LAVFPRSRSLIARMLNPVFSASFFLRQAELNPPSPQHLAEIAVAVRHHAHR